MMLFAVQSLRRKKYQQKIPKQAIKRTDVQSFAHARIGDPGSRNVRSAYVSHQGMDGPHFGDLCEEGHKLAICAELGIVKRAQEWHYHQFLIKIVG
jgi:hypothetical protein